MPTINRPKRNYNPKREKNDPERAKRRVIYSDPLWKRLRDAHLREHPLCEVCELEGKVTLAEHCHHLQSFSKGRDIMEMKTLAFDPTNLLAVCPLCHWEIHHGRFKGCTSLEDIKQYIEAQNASLSTITNK